MRSPTTTARKTTERELVIDLRVDPIQGAAASGGQGNTSSSPESSNTPALVLPDLKPSERSGVSRFLVRLFDLTVAICGFVVLAPLMLIVAVILRATSPGPIFYGSPRLGSGQSTFRAWKFRSMYVDADERLERLLSEDEAARLEYDEYRKLSNDPRITGIGNWIRKSSIDELPQLYNILKGEMSVVGPRPKLLNERERYGDALDFVLDVKPGLTGLWQVSGRNNLTVEDRVILDVRYVAERSLWGDVCVCLKTFWQLWRPGKHGAL